MTAILWPLAFKPASQEFYIRSLTTQFNYFITVARG